MLQLIPGQQIHFIGIGGAGLSAIARVLLDQGFVITGSDLNYTDLLETLEQDGATIYRGHNASFVGQAELVIASSAIPSEHIEILTAQAQGIPVYKRKDIMEAIMYGHYNIAIAGTHGKTTTTSMVVHILQEGQKDPSFIVGGKMGNTGKNAGIGNGDAFVVEADEYDNMFHGLRPHIEVITNVEHEHVDFFKTPRQLINSYSHFVGLLPDDGILVACADDSIASIFLRNRLIVELPVISYGIDNMQADWRAVDIRDEDDMTVFTVLHRDERMGEVRLSVPGHHNVLNALAAIIVGYEQGVDFVTATNALASFKNTGRRFDIRGTRDDVIVIDDYAHHPTEIKTTIHAARQRYPDREIWAVWQPHTYSRVKQFASDFVNAFDDAHHVVVTPIFASREKPIANINSENLIEEMSHPSVQFAPTLKDTVEFLRDRVKPNSIILTMSAGDAYQISTDYLTEIEQEI